MRCSGLDLLVELHVASLLQVVDLKDADVEGVARVDNAGDWQPDAGCGCVAAQHCLGSRMRSKLDAQLSALVKIVCGDALQVANEEETVCFWIERSEVCAGESNYWWAVMQR